jgi:hypothetical protein
MTITTIAPDGTSKCARRVVTQMKKAAYSAALQLRGMDLNLRPLGYEPKI